MFDHNRKVAAQIANLTKLIAARVVPSAPILLVPPISLIGPGLAWLTWWPVQYSTGLLGGLAQVLDAGGPVGLQQVQGHQLVWGHRVGSLTCDAQIISNIYYYLSPR